MSESEKRLRDWMESAAPWSMVGPEALDALLAEHRAEVERLESERDTARDECGAALHFAGTERTKAEAARDAALEEAHAAAKAAEYDHDPTVTRRKSLEAIRALKSQPARQYVDVEKVREVAESEVYDDTKGLDAELTAYNKGIKALAKRLDVDLDAKGGCIGCIPGNGVVPDGHVAFANVHCPVHGDKADEP